MTTFTEVDGVPVLIAPTSGPMRAGLMFRVGRADETLARSGVTHLVEHLALHRLGVADYHYNGSTGATITQFHMQGSPADVTAFLIGVCESLRDLPRDRLDTERAVVETEWRSRALGPAEGLALWRYGARGYGLLGFPEIGLPMIGPEDLEQWVARYFTRDNAVVWVAGGSLPAGLKLDLPPGDRQPLPPETPTLPRTPAYVSAGSMLAFEGLVRRSAASSVYSALLERQLFRDLRQRQGLSYTASAFYEPHDGERGTVTAVADAHEGREAAVVGGFVDVLTALRMGELDDAEIGAVRAKALEDLAHGAATGEHLTWHGFNTLVGHRHPTLEELRDEMQAVTAEDVQAVAVEAAESGLLMVPDGTTADWAGFEAAPTSSESVVTGERYRWHGSNEVKLVVGAEGVSVTDGHKHLTVRFDRVAAMLTWPDGGRQLIGDDALTVRVEPTLCAVDQRALARIDAAVPPSATVRMPPRQPHEVPQPVPKEPLGRRVARAPARLAAWSVARLPGCLAVLIVAAMIATALAVVGVVVSVVAYFFSPSLAVFAALGFLVAFLAQRYRSRDPES